VQVAELRPGKCFGELALLNPESRRAASVVAATHCSLVVISRQLYAEVLQVCHLALVCCAGRWVGNTLAVVAAPARAAVVSWRSDSTPCRRSRVCLLQANVKLDLEERQSFFRTLTLFRDWNSKRLTALFYAAKAHTIPTRSHVFNAGDAVDGVHFIRTGYCKVRRPAVECDTRRADLVHCVCLCYPCVWMPSLSLCVLSLCACANSIVEYAVCALRGAVGAVASRSWSPSDTRCLEDHSPEAAW
jgi:hypothetical protein